MEELLEPGGDPEKPGKIEQLLSPRAGKREVETWDPALYAKIEQVESATGLDLGKAFDTAALDPSLSGSSILGYASDSHLETNHSMDSAGENFMGLNPDLLYLPHDLTHTVIHEGVHGLDSNDMFLEEYRDQGRSMAEAAFLKDTMRAEEAGAYSQEKVRGVKEAATEYAARKLNEDHHLALTSPYQANVEWLERYMEENGIYPEEEYEALEDRDVTDVEYDPGRGLLREVGEFDDGGETYRYVATARGLDRDYRAEEKMDEGIAEVMDDPSDDYGWYGAGQEVTVRSGQKAAGQYEAGIAPGN